MGMMKDYMLAMIVLGSDSQEQEAIEWAIYQGWFKPTYNFPQDKLAIERQLLVFVEKLQQEAREKEAIKNTPMREFVNSIAGVPA
jgi:hypothetical protein